MSESTSRAALLAHQAPESAIPQWARAMFARPAGIPESEAKVFPLRIACFSLGVVLHVTLALIYLGMGVVWGGVINLGSVAVFLIGILLLRAGWTQLGNVVGWLEVVAHVTVFTLLIGMDGGYLFYVAILLVAPFSVFRASVPTERLLLGVIVSAGLILPIVLPLVLSDRAPIWPIEPWQVRAICVVNVLNVVVALVAIAYYASWVTERAEAGLAHEHERSEALLLNILPPVIAERLKADPGTIAEHYESVTVLFADICGFTLLSARIPSHELIAMLNEVFTTFDGLAETHGLEKIKTIGDAYMAACGLPEVREGHAQAVAAMALDMTKAIQAYAEKTGSDLNIRVGIHTGPVVAGVIGTKRFSYDLWGDTVNTASRMESHGAPGRVHLSRATRDALGDAFEFEARGMISVKGKGEMETWFLVGAQAE
ncbi:MAG: adenylate/guanylate cyclase domain-containing protein [Planctomycetes bacterium]|nr:adenylate/guanylate cyclase domain-containing protein [Planctomycetota bacterium]